MTSVFNNSIPHTERKSNKNPMEREEKNAGRGAFALTSIAAIVAAVAVTLVAVFATGDNGYGACNVSEWTNIVSVAVSTDATIVVDREGQAHNKGYKAQGDMWSNIRLP